MPINGKKSEAVFPKKKSRIGLQIKVQTEIMRDLEGEDNLRNLTFRILNFFTFKLLCKCLKFVFEYAFACDYTFLFLLWLFFY